jgi:hypothetical protein
MNRGLSQVERVAQLHVEGERHAGARASASRGATGLYF